MRQWGARSTSSAQQQRGGRKPADELQDESKGEGGAEESRKEGNQTRIGLVLETRQLKRNKKDYYLDNG